MKKFICSLVVCAASLQPGYALSGVIDPDCTPEKAAKSAAAKATIGKGGRCSPADAAKDATKKITGIEDKGAVKNAKDKVNAPAEKMKKVIK